LAPALFLPKSTALRELRSPAIMMYSSYGGRPGNGCVAQGEDCTACGASCGGGGPGSLAYVGTGRGEFVQETTIKYVGCGGDFDVRPRRDFTCLITTCCLLSLLLLIPLLLWLLSGWPTSDSCDTDFAQWRTHWSSSKQQFCCATVGKACPEPELSGPHPPQGPVGPVDPFNCADGVLNWQAGWSTQKKQWCCQQHGKGCGHDEEVAAAEYDCNAAFANWVKGWSEGKKTWCCSYGYKSCPSDASAAGAGYGAGTQHGANFNGAPVAAILHTPFAQTR